MFQNPYRNEDILWGGGKLRIVESLVVLHGHQNAVVARPTFSEVIGLKVECILRKTIAIGEIVDTVDNIKCVDNCGVDVFVGFWV